MKWTPVKVFALLALLAIAVAACVPIQPESPSGTVPMAPAAADPLDGTGWVLAQVAGADGALVDVPAGVSATMNFSEATAAGSTGCNRYTVGYSVDGDTLTWTSAPAMTMMACVGPGGDVEQAFMAALPNVSTFAVANDTLTLSDADGNALLVFNPAVSTLAGTSWSVTGYNNGNQAVVSLAVDTAISLNFGTDGIVSGQACNNFSGGYTEDGESISIDPLASTMMACDPQEVMDQEALFLLALPQSATWQIDGDSLTLRDAEGAMTVTAVAAPVQ